MCHEGQSLSGARDRIDVRPVGSSLGVLTDPAMMSAAFARAPWPSFQRHLSSIKSTPGRHWAGILQNSGTALASLDRNVAKLWHHHHTEEMRLAAVGPATFFNTFKISLERFLFLVAKIIPTRPASYPTALMPLLLSLLSFVVSHPSASLGAC